MLTDSKEIFRRAGAIRMNSRVWGSDIIYEPICRSVWIDAHFGTASWSVETVAIHLFWFFSEDTSPGVGP